MWLLVSTLILFLYCTFEMVYEHCSPLLKWYLESKSRLPISEFSGSHYGSVQRE